MRIVSILIVGLVACGGGNKGGGGATGGEPKKLYDRLGGHDAVHAVVEDFVANLKADARISARFQNMSPDFPQKLEDQICSATGGGCEYKGKDMKTAHIGMNITEADFNALVEDLKKSLVKFKVGDKEQSELLGALAGYKGDIVTAK